MLLLDANILIYAFRSDSPHHAACYGWLTGVLAGEEPVATASVVELALLRVSTLSVLGTAAAGAAEVFRFLASLRQQSWTVRIEPGEHHLKLFQDFCVKLKLRGNDLNDAFLAALAIEYDATLVTADKGFSRFPGLRILYPTT